MSASEMSGLGLVAGTCAEAIAVRWSSLADEAAIDWIH
jgi:hypothetical protein